MLSSLPALRNAFACFPRATLLRYFFLFTSSLAYHSRAKLCNDRVSDRRWQLIKSWQRYARYNDPAFLLADSPLYCGTIDDRRCCTILYERENRSTESNIYTCVSTHVLVQFFLKIILLVTPLFLLLLLFFPFLSSTSRLVTREKAKCSMNVLLFMNYYNRV